MHLIYLSLIVITSLCPRITDPPAWFSWLAGTWVQQKSNGNQRLEVWEFDDDNSLKGKGLKVTGTDTTLLEYISLRLVDGQILYIPTVPDQNHGQPIVFPLIKEERLVLTFENLSHDFPQRIRYAFKPVDAVNTLQVTSGDTLSVRVESQDGEGFEFLFHRQ